MTALAYLHEHGLDAETLMGDQIAVWPEQSITPAMECWIVEHKAELLSELRRQQQGTLTPWRVFIDGKLIATLLTNCKTLKEAQASAQGRWPRKNVSVKAWRAKS